MSVSGITEGDRPQSVKDSRQKPAPTGFSRVLNDVVPVKENSEAANSAEAPVIELGRISKETPTVSHILVNHPEYAHKCWDIVFSSENRGKQYTKMREGTTVALKPGSNELVWDMDRSTGYGRTASQGTGSEKQTGTVDKTVLIGTISRKHPTVSHLFQANPRFGRGFWDIINAAVNNGKDYYSLRPGTRVELNSETMELSFVDQSPDHSNTRSAKIITQKPEAANNGNNYVSLADAVKPYIGTPYNQIDCYGLIVRGLTNQGIQYNGTGGLREKLEELAISEGRPGNAYFNGEGLVERTGIKVYSKSIDHISNTREKTDEIYSEMEPYLKEGMILSFSTPTRGHTGVVSRRSDEWTYINSGVIDHEVSSGRVSKRVGEEILKAEINNWCVLAAGRHEPLIVTVGHVDGNKLNNYRGLKETI
ncbi:MAG: hypothetical protein AB1499_14945 [Nitrospirota bacterium]